ncbi:ATP-binding protein [Maribacter arcticus]|uniref:histidine kinase n=1 Tax=Maribacter arcticus TaxID=561365 RepID=A0A1T5AIS0_9FLAO|nr:ATP-binding protein [Maribacter arcticus]SKB34901.1 His Kinase A (phospho-acceptor) domain-containing protein [Maribacter arcticus]
MNEFSKRRVKLVFILSLFTTGITALWFFLARSLNLHELSLYIAATMPFFICSAIISKVGNLTLARFIYLVAFNISVAITSSFIGKAGSVEFILLFAMALPFVFFSFRREKSYVALFPVLSIVLWILLYVTDFNLFTITKIDTTLADTYIYPVSIFTTAVLVTYQLIFFSMINARYYSNIQDEREDAIEASNAKSQFLSMMSHEIRTPMNAIIGLSHILGDTNPRPDQEENIEALNYSGKILLNLLNNVLDYSKMETSGVALDPIPTDVMSAVKQIKKIHEPGCLGKGITFKLQVDEKLPMLLLDIVRFNQVINNLVSNGIKFTKQGSVTLKITKQEDRNGNVRMRTEIIDTGIGITKEQQEKIWQPFTQASINTNRLYGGTGLGLPIVKSIVEAMGSAVHIESEVAQGSRFYFDIEVKSISNEKLNQDSGKKERNLKGRRILLVEDNKINIMVGKQILERANLVVDVAFDGLMAVNMVKENDYCAVLMDIQMPIMDGYTSSIEIRKFNTTLPILALSASVFLEVKSKIEQSGMNGFIFKPFDPEDLYNRIEAVIDMPLAS